MYVGTAVLVGPTPSLAELFEAPPRPAELSGLCRCELCLRWNLRFSSFLLTNTYTARIMSGATNRKNISKPSRSEVSFSS